MTATWILVADSSRARLFSVDKALAPLQEIESFTHPECRAKNQDLNTDRPARRNGGTIPDASVEPKWQEAMHFAKRLSEHLKSGRVNGRFQRLHIAASPAFLGLLREKLDGPTAQLVVSATSKDLTQLDPAEIRRHLPERL
ncbi:MAG TPA: host attachment protein [Candidatus Competibacteraceae bacterium]|nr:host attachment protein [Candidatus Competibacteraceae bacterium]